MLSKVVGIIIAAGLFIIPGTADAHPHKRVRVQKPAPAVVVTLGWVWIDATRFRGAHWQHPHYGRSHRAFNAGPPPARPHAHAVWVPGHWEGRRHNRHWVPGHWRR